MSNQKFDEMYKGNNTKELTALAKELGVPRYYTLNKKELVLAILEKRVKRIFIFQHHKSVVLN